MSHKEAAVYLANLVLGPSSVQTISLRAKIPRATTYVILKSLANNNLVVRNGRKNKTKFKAKHPSQIIKLLKDQKKAIGEQHQKLEKNLPSLEAVMKKTDSEPIVRHYSGLEGIETIFSEMTAYTQPQDTWRGFFPLDQVNNTLGKKKFMHVRQRISKNVTTKLIFTTTSKEIKQKMLTSTTNRIKRKFISPKKVTSSSSFLTYSDRVFIGTFSKNPNGIVIESNELHKLFKEIFDLLWDQLD